MAKNITIQKITADQDTDYSQLRNSGIEFLQQLSGDIWTDYNEHDPGVTILEELCYMLTELYERAEIPIASILTQKNGKLPAKENALFSAAKILHNNPLIPNDYRKLLVDRVKEINNAWVIPSYFGADFSETLGIAGMYQVMVDLQEGIITSTTELAIIEDEIRQVINANRNVGEIFPEITFLTQVPLTISCNVYMTAYVDAEAVLATVLFDIENYLKPGVVFYSYDEMVGMGFTTDEIFEGPKLQHGFIQDSTLTDPVSVVYEDFLLKLITQVQGVSGVIGLSLSDPEGKDTTQGYYNVAAGSSVFLDLMQSLDSIKIYRQNVLYPYNKNLVISNYNELRSSTKRPGKLKLSRSKLDIEIPKGIYADPAKYFSMQNDFPVVYGIGTTSRLSKSATDTRKAQALQLKAYLLYYEQVLADYMEQVANTNQLFSVEKQDRTFFYQPLYGVPDGPPLLKGFGGRPSEIYDAMQGAAYVADCKTFEQSQNDYITGLENLYKETDDFSSRRNGFLDHLLSRFNYALHAFSASYANPVIKDFTFDDIAVKEHLLKHMCEITASRGSIATYTANENGESKTYVSGLEKSLRILSGVGHSDLKDIQINNYSIVSPSASGEKEIVIHLDQSKQVHINTRHESFHELLEAGMFLENYNIEDHGHEQVISLGVGNKIQKLYTVHPHTQSETPQNIIKELINDFLKMYLQYENFFAVEHILLKPANKEKKFTWIDQANQKMPPPEPAEYDTLETSIGSAFATYNQNKVYNTKPDPLIVVDHADSYISQYFYSARVSLFLPESSATIKGRSFQDYFNYLVVTNFPAHIRVEVFWLKSSEYPGFVKLYENYTAGTAGAREQMVDYLFQQPGYEGLKISK